MKRAIIYLKFSCEETESILFAGSPFINSVLEKLLEIDDLHDKSTSSYFKKNIPNEDFILSKLERLDKEEGRKTDESIKLETLKTCLYPYSI